MHNQMFDHCTLCSFPCTQDNLRFRLPFYLENCIILFTHSTLQCTVTGIM